MRSGKPLDKRACPSCGVLITMPVSSPRARLQCPRCLNIIALDASGPDAGQHHDGPTEAGPAAEPPRSRSARNPQHDAPDREPPDAEPSTRDGYAQVNAEEASDGEDGTRRMAGQLERLGRECAALRRELADAKGALTDAAKMIAGIIILEQKITDLGWICMTANSGQTGMEETEADRDASTLRPHGAAGRAGGPALPSLSG